MLVVFGLVLIILMAPPYGAFLPLVLGFAILLITAAVSGGDVCPNKIV